MESTASAIGVLGDRRSYDLSRSVSDRTASRRMLTALPQELVLLVCISVIGGGIAIMMPLTHERSAWMWWQEIYIPPNDDAAARSCRSSECEAETESDPVPEPRAGTAESAITCIDVREEKEEVKDLKSSLESYFKLYNPSKLHNVDKLVEEFNKKPWELNKLLVQRYGHELQNLPVLKEQAEKLPQEEKGKQPVTTLQEDVNETSQVEMYHSIQMDSPYPEMSYDSEALYTHKPRVKGGDPFFDECSRISSKAGKSSCVDEVESPFAFKKLHNKMQLEMKRTWNGGGARGWGSGVQFSVRNGRRASKGNENGGDDCEIEEDPFAHVAGKEVGVETKKTSAQDLSDLGVTEDPTTLDTAEDLMSGNDDQDLSDALKGRIPEALVEDKTGADEENASDALLESSGRVIAGHGADKEVMATVLKDASSVQEAAESRTIELKEGRRMTKEEIYQDFVQNSQHGDDNDLTFPSPSQSPSTRSSRTQELPPLATTPPTPSELSFASLKEEQGDATKQQKLEDDVARRIREELVSKSHSGEANEVYYSFHETAGGEGGEGERGEGEGDDDDDDDYVAVEPVPEDE
eukprot:758838-Hanusia_phi.AAC.2